MSGEGFFIDHVIRGRDRVLWWSLGVDDLDDTAAARGAAVRVGQAGNANRDTLTFRSAGMPHRHGRW